MFGKPLAALLILLSVSPFTTPFSTCDLATLTHAPDPAGSFSLRAIASPTLAAASLDQVLVLTAPKRRALRARSSDRLSPLAANLASPGLLRASSLSRPLPSRSISPGILRI